MEPQTGRPRTVAVYRHPMTTRTFSFEINHTSTADPATLFRLETDARHWSEWGRPLIIRSGWQRWANPPGSVGAIRRVGLWPVLMYEETVEFEQDRRHVYTFARRAPINDYRGEVLFKPNASGGTDLCWRGSFTERFPRTGPLALWFLRSTLGFLSTRLVQAAERG